MTINRTIVFLALACAATQPLAARPAPTIERDLQKAFEQESFSAQLARQAATHARSDGFAGLADLLAEMATRYERQAAEHRKMLAPDKLVDDLKQLAGAVIAQHQHEAEASTRARALEEPAIADHLQALANQSARDRDSLATAIAGRDKRAE